ncbi:rCG44594, isoform CRA_b [Rattus norvegicus]|uniref:RCG44594, isoform CRA_b n=1 Tax=Rattus norvegicus TaxID=10116 RepID=A6I5I8_RAT|nr:rCG44594, isoform CRA_b [Rattus norvegicus]
MFIRTEMRKKHTDVYIYQLYSQRQVVSENSISNVRSEVEHSSWVGS